MQHPSKLDDLALANAGVITHQILLSEFTPRQIYGLRQRGQIFDVARGIYRLAGVPTNWRLNVRAAVLASGEGAFASGRSACRLWGLRINTNDRVEVTVPRGRQPEVPMAKIHTSNIASLFITAIDGIAVSNPERTLLELSRFRADESARKILEDAVIRRIVDLDRLVKTRNVMRARGRRNFGVWTRVLPEILPELKLVGTSTEERAVKAWTDVGIDLPQPQYKIIIDGVDNYLDFAYPELKIAIECDGYVTHDVLRAVKDRKRDRWLTTHGWIILRFPNSASNFELTSDVKAALALRQNAA